jgi:hypothetical protein
MLNGNILQPLIISCVDIFETNRYQNFLDGNISCNQFNLEVRMGLLKFLIDLVVGIIGLVVGLIGGIIGLVFGVLGTAIGCLAVIGVVLLAIPLLIIIF